MTKTPIKITDEQIAAKKDIFLTTIEREKKLAASGRVSHIQSFLNKINDLIEVAINDGLSYKQIAKTIYLTWSVKVSDQTVKRFAENTLGIKKNTSRKQSAPIAEPKPAPSAEHQSPVTESKSTPGAEHKTDGVKHVPANFDDI